MRCMVAACLGFLVSCGGSGGGGGGGDDTGTDGGSRGGTSPSGPFFTQPMFFDADVSASAPAADSASQIAALEAAGGWGNGNKFQVDTSINVLAANSTTPHRTFTDNGDWSSPDCDMFDVPVPDGGNVEGEDGYACTMGGDCHLLVMDSDAQELYELWEADIESSSSFTAGCLARWDTSITYTDTLRGDQCTSADAAGFPIAPLLFTADEVASGTINHAIRFTLPNDRLKVGYVRPATHGTRTTGGDGLPSYGVHLRLHADFDLSSLPSDGARTVAKALQKYGMYQADGGDIALTARDDRDSTAKWADQLDSHDLALLKVTDFDVIDHGDLIPLTLDCVR